MTGPCRVLGGIALAILLSAGVVEAQETGTDAPALRIAYCQDCVPFAFTGAAGAASGSLIDIWRLWATKTGRAVTFLAAPSDDTLAMVVAGRADIHAGLFKTAERDRVLDFGVGLRSVETHVFLHKDLPALGGLDDLRAYRVGVLAGDAVEDWLGARIGAPSVVAYPGYQTLIAAAITGQVRVFAADTPTGLHHLRAVGLADLYRVRPNQRLYAHDFHAAVAEGRADLIVLIEEGMAQITAAERRAIGRRWSGAGDAAADDGALIIAIFRDYPPFSFTGPDGRPAGFLIDFWRLWAKTTETRIRFRASGWIETLEALRRGEADLHSGLFRNRARTTWLDFTAPIHEIKTAVFRRATDPPYTMALRPGARVGVLAGSYQADWLAMTHPEAIRALYPSGDAMLLALVRGEVEAVVNEAPTIKASLDGLGLGGLVRRDRTLFANTLVGAVAKGADALLAMIDAGLAAMPRSALVALDQRWLPDADDRFYRSGEADPTSAALPDGRGSGTPAGAAESGDPDRAGVEGAVGIGRLLANLGAISVAFIAAMVAISWALRRVFARAGGLGYRSRAAMPVGLALVAVFLVSVILASWFVLGRLEQRARRQAGQSLETVLETTHRAVRLWADDRLRATRDLAADPRLVDLMVRLGTLDTARHLLTASWETEEIRDFLRDRRAGLGFTGFFVLTPDGVTIASDRDADLGGPSPLHAVRAHAIAEILDGHTVFIPPVQLAADAAVGGDDRGGEAAGDALFFAAPITDGDDRPPIAVLALRIDPAEVFLPLLALGRIGASGETYAIDRDARLISESRFTDQLSEIGLIAPGSPTSWAVRVLDPGRDLTDRQGGAIAVAEPASPTVSAAEALAGRSGASTVAYRDYRGVPVLGAWLWDARLGIGLITEIDAHEALASYRLVHTTIVALLGATVLLGLGLTSVSVWIGQSATRALARANGALERRVAARTAELAEKESHLRAALDNMSDGIYMIDRDGRYTLTNHRYPAMMDLPHHLVDRGRDVREVIRLHAERGEYGELPLGEAIRHGTAALVSDATVVREMSVRDTGRIVELRKSPIAGGGAVVLLSDVTARIEAQHKLEIAEERARLILHSVGDGVFGVDRAGRLGFANPKALELLGYTAGELLGRGIHAIVHHSQPDGSPYPIAECPVYRAYTDGVSERIDDEVLWRKDGTPVEVEYHAAPIVRRGELAGAVIAFADITERKRVERERNEALAVVSSSIRYASRIQRAILPDPSIFAGAFADHLVIWEPRDVVGGDIYWCDVWGDGLLVMIGDCTGHGVPGAFVTLLAAGALARARMEIAPGDLSELVRRMHQLLQITLGQHLEGGQSDDGMDLAACYLAADGTRLVFVGANLGLFVAESDQIREIKGNRVGIGYRKISRDQAYTGHEVAIGDGVAVYLTTDGLIDQVGGGGRRRTFGKARLKALLREVSGLPMAAQGSRLMAALAEFQGAERRRDDVSVIGFRA